MKDKMAEPASDSGVTGSKAKKSPASLVLIAIVAVVAIAAIVLLLLPHGKASNTVASRLEAQLPLDRPMGLAEFASILNGSMSATNQSGSFNGTYSGSINVSARAGTASFSVSLPFNETEQVNGNASRLEMVVPMEPLSGLSGMLGSLQVNTTMYIYVIKNGTRNYLCAATTTHSAQCVSESALQSMMRGSSSNPGQGLNLSSLLSGTNITITGKTQTSYNGQSCELFAGSLSGSLSGLWGLMYTRPYVNGKPVGQSAAQGPAPTVNGTMSACISSAPGPVELFNASAAIGIGITMNRSSQLAVGSPGNLRFTISIGVRETSSGEAAPISSITALPGPLQNSTYTQGVSNGTYGGTPQATCVAATGFMCADVLYNHAGMMFEFGQGGGQDYYGDWVFVAGDSEAMGSSGLPINFTCTSNGCANAVAVGPPGPNGVNVLAPGNMTSVYLPASHFATSDIPPYTSTPTASVLVPGTPFLGHVWLGYCLTSNCTAPTNFAYVAAIDVKSSD